MTLTIILFLMVSLGISMFAYAMKRERDMSREQGLKDRKDVHEGKSGNF